MIDYNYVKKILDKKQKIILKKKGIVATGIGYKIINGVQTHELALVCSVDKKRPLSEIRKQDLIPAEVKGVLTDVVEVGIIKALHTKRYRPAPGGVSIGHECYDDQTRVLTDKGLKLFKDVETTDKIATLKNNKELEYHHPTELFKYDYDGDLIHFQGKTIDLMVTPNHKIYYTNRYNSKSFELEEAEKVLQNNAYQSIQFKRNCEWHCSTPAASFTIPPQTQKRQIYESFMGWNGSMVDFVKQNEIAYKTVWRWRHNLVKPGVFRSKLTFSFDDWLEFLGWYLSEGSSFVGHQQSTVTISENSGRYHKEIMKLLDRMGINGCITKSKAIQFSHKELAIYLKRFGTAKKKYIPDTIKSLPVDKLEIILLALMKGDGHFENKKYRHYKTVSWQLANDVFEIAFKCGYGVTIRQDISNPHRFENRVIKGGIAYRIGFSHVKLTPRLAKQPKKIPYKGKVYCLEVPNHIIFVERKGKTCWSGNSVSCGTLGCLVKKAGEQYILSNNHVLSNSNDADIGDDILQPGVYDGGTNSSDRIAKLSDFVKLNFIGVPSECSISKVFTLIVNSLLRIMGSKTNIQSVKQTETNTVDAAIAKPVKDEHVTDEIMGLGKIVGIKPAILGMKIKKSGRTTGLTTGEIIQMGVTTNVQYGDGKTATFTDQFMTGPMSAGGDSGSAILTEDNHIVGLLYAGSEQVTLCNKIENVFKLLHIDGI